MKLFAISVICPDLSRLGDFTARFIGIISRSRDGAYCIASLPERDAAAFYRRRLTYFYRRRLQKILVLTRRDYRCANEYFYVTIYLIPRFNERFSFFKLCLIQYTKKK